MNWVISGTNGKSVLEQLRRDLKWHKEGSKGWRKLAMGSFREPVKRQLLPWNKVEVK